MMGGGGMMNGFGGFGLLGGLIGLIFNLAILIGIVLLIVWAVKQFSKTGHGNESLNSQSPREVLQTRYARGEINREQYQQILQDLA